MPPTQTLQQFRDIGPAELTYKGVVLGKTEANPSGGTHGGVGITINTEKRPSFRDAEGTNEHDGTIVGRKLAVEANLTGLSLVQMAAMIPGAELSSGAQKSLVLNSPVGMSQRANAGELIIKPIDSGVVSTNPKEWITIPLAFPEPDMEFKFDLESQKVYKVNFVTFNVLTGKGQVATLGQNST
jgi:hypothetical protein